jgi:ribonucleoside-diphosphate reductase beta chain
MPKPEIGAVGFTFAESEVRHMDAYSHLLEILGLNEEFEKITEVFRL